MKAFCFDTLRLNRQEKQYAKHYVQTNMRLAIVVVMVLCLFVLGLLIPEQLIGIPLFLFDGSLGYYHEVGGMAMFFISICILAYLLPLFQFRFLMKRSHSDLYLSLPIERKRLFYVHYVIGLLFIVVCAFVELFVMYVFSAPKGSEWFALNKTVLMVCAVYILLGSCLYTFFVAFIMHCHRVLDGIFICMIYTLLPLMLYYSLSALFYSVQEQVLEADRFYTTIKGSYIIEGSDMGSHSVVFIFASLLSIPWQMNCWLDVANSSVVVSNETMLFLQIALLAWLIIAVLCFLHARDVMVRIRSEMSEQPTRSLFTYPMLIPATTLLIILGIGSGKIISLPIMIIFVLYLLAHCFAQRKLTCDVRNIVIYAAIVLLSSAVYHVAMATDCFHTVHEIPPRDQLDAMQVEITTYQETEGYATDISQMISDPVVIKEWVSDHEAVAVQHQKVSNTLGWSTMISFTYYYGDKMEVRSYQFAKQDEEKIHDLIHNWYEKKYLQSQEFKDTME